MSLMNRRTQKRNQKIVIYVLVGLVIISFIMSMVLPLWF
jgi:hypothetical protein